MKLDATSILKFSGGLANTPVNLSGTLYGWRNYGGFAMLFGAFATSYSSLWPWYSGTPPTIAVETPFPSYFAYKLLTKWALNGDSVVKSSSDSLYLSAHAAILANGDEAVFFVNKLAANNLQVNFELNNFALKGKVATLYSYGKDNDTNQTDITVSSIRADTNISLIVPSYSMNVLIIPGH